MRSSATVPAVKMEECAREGDVVVRTCLFKGKRYFYAVNTSDEAVDIKFAFPDGTKEIPAKKSAADTFLRLKPYELRSFVADGK